MSTDDDSDDAHSAPPFTLDVGLLSPVSIGAGHEASDRSVFSHLVGAELALLRAFVATGVAPESVGAAAHAVRMDLWLDLDLPAFAQASVAGGNPVIPLIPLVRERIAAQDPDAAAWVHRGATSQDILDTALMTLGREVSWTVTESLSLAAGALITLAQRHRDDPAAARTLATHAVPTTLGLKAATWLRSIIRARRRLLEVVERLPAQLGGAAGTLASFVEWFGADQAAALPGAFAGKLGLQTIEAPWHTDRWPVTELGDALAAVVAAVGSFGTDVALLARTEIGEASVADGGGSSAMPQKQNPVDAVLIRSAALRAPALAAQLHLAAGLAVDERPDGAWHAEWPALQELMRLALGASAHAAALASGLTFHVDRARANLDLTHGLIVSERLGIALVPLIGKERFASLIAAASAGEDLGALLRALPEASELDVADLLDPAQYTGLAARLTDDAVRRALQDGIRP
ncbi:MAG TPA: lyase family protein [Microbacterium sp.]|nr:lyase family protein [Microbacterium sp.]